MNPPGILLVQLAQSDGFGNGDHRQLMERKPAPLNDSNEPGSEGPVARRQVGTAGVERGLPLKYRITDTKATARPRHRLMTPKAFYDAAAQGIDIFLGWEDEGSIRNATPPSTVGDGKELSHTWVVRKIGQARLVPEHERAMARLIERWRREFSRDASGKWRLSGKAPYDRSVVTVVQSNIDQHDKSTGGDLPTCTRPVKSHQIAAEFIIPTEIYFE